MVPWAHPSPQPKRHLDWCSRFCRAHYCDRPCYMVCNNRPHLHDVVLQCSLKMPSAESDKDVRIPAAVEEWKSFFDSASYVDGTESWTSAQLVSTFLKTYHAAVSISETMTFMCYCVAVSACGPVSYQSVNKWHDLAQIPSNSHWLLPTYSLLDCNDKLVFEVLTLGQPMRAEKRFTAEVNQPQSYQPGSPVESWVATANLVLFKNNMAHV